MTGAFLTGRSAAKTGLANRALAVPASRTCLMKLPERIATARLRALQRPNGSPNLTDSAHVLIHPGAGCFRIPESRCNFATCCLWRNDLALERNGCGCGARSCLQACGCYVARPQVVSAGHGGWASSVARYDHKLRAIRRPSA